MLPGSERLVAMIDRARSPISMLVRKTASPASLGAGYRSGGFWLVRSSAQRRQCLWSRYVCDDSSRASQNDENFQDLVVGICENRGDRMRPGKSNNRRC